MILLPESRSFVNEFFSNPDNAEITTELIGLDIKELKEMVCKISSLYIDQKRIEIEK